MSIEVRSDWWKTLFDEIYLLTDSRSVCDEDLTGREVDVICGILPMDTRMALLDLCGGQGRHSIELASRGFTGCTVLDYSRFLIERGRAMASEMGRPIRFLQGDARETGLPSESFDCVIIMGNSLGYLPRPEDDLGILAESMRLLKPGSRVLVDTADGEQVREEMSPVAWHEVDETVVVCRRREIAENAVSARELVLCKDRGLLRDQTYRIRLFDGDMLVRLLSDAGFSAVQLYRNFTPHDTKGDYGFMDRRIVAVGIKPDA
ncbi:MAG TPA: class I SAM-dependent methyltransferase [Proteobacteria bacterium]|nr:glycine/sarcosine N-methyltransferase [bacterium BMS3Abin14]HDL53632.1 class I SAM-dependent methyltransferase [Pseudomonadota bacterium]